MGGGSTETWRGAGLCGDTEVDWNIGGGGGGPGFRGDTGVGLGGWLKHKGARVVEILEWAWGVG